MKAITTALFAALFAASPALAALPRTVNVQGHLTTGGGATVTDGDYTFTWRLYTSEGATVAAWTAVEPLVPVVDGLFSATLGDEPGATPPPATLFSSPLWLGITVDSEPELPRRPIHAVPQALYADSAAEAVYALWASDLQCSGCVGPSELAAGAVEPSHLSNAARALFLSASGGTVSGAVTVNGSATVSGPVTASGGVDLAGSLLTGARFAAGNVAGQSCGAAELGRVVVDAASARLYWCNGATWLRLATCTGSCKAPASVPCGTLITDDCGDVSATCTGKGAGCPAGQLCGTTGCFNDGGSALSPTRSCKDLHAQAPSLPSGSYWLDPDGNGGLAPFLAPCDMVTSGGGWTVIEYSADLPFQNHFTSGDGFKYLPTDFKTVLTPAQIAAIQAVSTEGQQTYVGQCENVIHYYYTADPGYGYAFGFRFLDGAETVTASQSYAPYDISVPQDGCKGNGGENGSLALATLFSIRSVRVPVVNVKTRDSGDPTEKFGSPLTANPALLR